MNFSDSKNISSIKNILNTIKSKYILKRIYSNIPKKLFLSIIRYNNQLQHKLDINITDFITLYETYTKIEIEIIPTNKLRKYNTFINYQKDFESYYHIYFNEKKEESNRNYFTKEDNIKKIKIIIDHQIKSFKGLFKECQCIKSINFIKFNRKNIIDMSYLFSGCSSLEELNLKNFKTNQVINMTNMFSGCISLKNLCLTNFVTNQVTNMLGLFSYCTSLKHLDLSSFNTNQVTNMSYMFYCCENLKELDLSNFITNNVIDMTEMFAKCLGLKKLNLYNFTNKANTKMDDMFYSCFSLLELNIFNLNITNYKEDISSIISGVPKKIKIINSNNNISF